MTAAGAKTAAVKWRKDSNDDDIVLGGERQETLDVRQDIVAMRTGRSFGGRGLGIKAGVGGGVE